MHTTRIKMKDGRCLGGVLWAFRPCLDWMEFQCGDGNLTRIKISDMKSCVTEGERMTRDKIGDCDEIERARRYMADSRKFGWDKGVMPKEKFEWEE